MFEKLVAIEPVNLVPEAEKALSRHAREVVLFRDVPRDAREIARRIGDADAVLVSWTSSIGRAVLERCPKVRYIGMCCSLYAPESANVDIRYANEHGIEVRGIRDYGDQGVVEYVVSELARLLLGLDGEPWDGMPLEIGGISAGIVGLGTSGRMIADALRFFGARVSYFSRTRKPDAEAAGIGYLPLRELLGGCDLVCTCLNKNVVLLGKDEFEALGSHKILFNTGLSPSFEPEPFRAWIADGRNRFFSDNVSALGDKALLGRANVRCLGHSSGMTRQALDRLSDKVLENLAAFAG